MRQRKVRAGSKGDDTNRNVDGRVKKKGKHKPRKVRKVNDFYKEYDETPDAVGSGNKVYNDELHPKIAYNLCSEHGLTRAQLARVFNITIKALDSWIYKNPNFREKYRAGKDDFDSKHVEQMLLKRALGFEYEETIVKKTTVKGKDMEGKVAYIPAKETTKITKFIAPETKAAQFWLTNRNPDRWKQTQSIKMDTNIEKKELKVNTADLSKMSIEQLKQLRELISTSAEQDGTVIPIECDVVKDGDVDEKKQIEYYNNIAKQVIEAEVEEEQEA